MRNENRETLHLKFLPGRQACMALIEQKDPLKLVYLQSSLKRSDLLVHDTPVTPTASLMKNDPLPGQKWKIRYF